MTEEKCNVCYKKVNKGKVKPIIVNGITVCDVCKECYNWINNLARRGIIMEWLHDYWVDKQN